MMDDLRQHIVGAIGAPARNNATAQAEAFEQLLANMERRHLDITRLIGEQTRLLALIHRQLASLEKRQDVEQVISVTTLPTPVYRQGRRHTLLWANAAQAIHANYGNGDTTINLVAGWNVMDFPESALIWLASGGPVSLFLRATDDVAPGLV